MYTPPTTGYLSAMPNLFKQEDIEKIRNEIILMGQKDQKYRQLFHSYPADAIIADSSSDKLDLLQFNKPIDRPGLIRLMNETNAEHSKRLSQIMDT